MVDITDVNFNNKLFQSKELPKELEDQLFSTIRQKLPPDVEDAVIRDIMATNMKVVKDYFLSL